MQKLQVTLGLSGLHGANTQPNLPECFSQAAGFLVWCWWLVLHRRKAEDVLKVSWSTIQYLTDGWICTIAARFLFKGRNRFVCISWKPWPKLDCHSICSPKICMITYWKLYVLRAFSNSPFYTVTWSLTPPRHKSQPAQARGLFFNPKTEIWIKGWQQALAPHLCCLQMEMRHVPTSSGWTIPHSHWPPHQQPPLWLATWFTAGNTFQTWCHLTDATYCVLWCSGMLMQFSRSLSPSMNKSRDLGWFFFGGVTEKKQPTSLCCPFLHKKSFYQP